MIDGWLNLIDALILSSCLISANGSTQTVDKSNDWKMKEPSASSNNSEEEKHLEKHKLRLVSDLSHLNRFINRAPRGTLHSLMPFLVITRLSPGQGILLPHHLPSPLWPLPVSPLYKNLKSLKARCHFQSQPKPSRVIQILLESSKAFQSLPKPFRVFQSLQESSKAFKSHPNPSRVFHSLQESSKSF